MNDKFIKLRKKLHANPELSGEEIKTAGIVKDFISQFNPDNVLESIGGAGIAFIFNGKTAGKTLLFRAELDALPIKEINEIDYKSNHENISHMCGHDGHMAILCRLAYLIREENSFPGKIILMFQPEEENGQGAQKMLVDEKWSELNPDMVFALHNIPGYPIGTVLIKDDVISSASVGMIIKLTGKTTHSGHPEKGINPSKAVASIILEIEKFNSGFPKSQNTFATIAGIRSGEKAFGISPGDAELYLTLRSYSNESLSELKEKIKTAVNNISLENNLKYEINYTEEFIAVTNDKEAVSIVKKSAAKSGLNIIDKETPFSWSEDFGRFTDIYKGCLFGIGAGDNSPALHNSDYDFPDELIIPASDLFYTIIKIANIENS